MSIVPDERSEAESSLGKEQAKARTENRDYVWKYWSFHADQRLKTFNFFILFTTVLVAGSLAYLKDARQPNLAAPCGVLMTAICWLFWRLDCRNRALIRHAEGILKQIEQDISPEIVPVNQRLFCVEDCDTKKGRSISTYFSWQAPLSFYHVFRSTFCVFGLLGLLLFLGSLQMPSRTESSAPVMPVQKCFSKSSNATDEYLTDAPPQESKVLSQSAANKGDTIPDVLDGQVSEPEPPSVPK
jgi:hypothetical protein